MVDEHPEPDRSGPPGSGRPRPGLRALGTLLIGALSIGLLFWVAPPDQLVEQLGDLRVSWVLAAIGLEFGSCLGYVVVFRRFFPEPPRGVSRRVAWTAMGAGAVLPGGNISSAAATGWLLRRHDIGPRLVIERSAGLLCLLTAFGFAVNGLAGLLLLVGVSGGPHDFRHTMGPILVSVAVLGGATAIVVVARRLGDRGPRALRAVASALEGAWSAAKRPHWRLGGVAAFLCLDMGALWAACAATGRPLGVLALAIAYCIGYLATMVPMPAGLGVLDSGLAGALVLYGMKPAASVTAVLVYHAISIWVPGLGGLSAWLATRRSARAARAATAPSLPPAVGGLPPAVPGLPAAVPGLPAVVPAIEPSH